MPPKPWEVISTIRDKSYRVFALRKDTALSPRTGKTHDFFILESSSWVNVIPLTKDNQVVLVRQYRHGTGEVTLEIPGGLVENKDTPEQAAWRELAEETGYGAEEMISLGFVFPNPAIQNNKCFTFLAKNAMQVGEQDQDGGEDIEILLKPLSEIPGLIRTGVISHSLVVAAFYRFFMEHARGPGR
ncbi:MAG: NUDIX hydrolase [Desulfatiglandaceae bacterium]